jgi:hypothetical protein
MLVVLQLDFVPFGDLALSMALLCYETDFIYVALRIVALRRKHLGLIATNAGTATYRATFLVTLVTHQI